MGKLAGRPGHWNERGQGKTEYVIIIALIAIAAIGVYSFFGQTTLQQDAEVAKKDPSGKVAAKEVAGEQGAASQLPVNPGETKGAGDSGSVGSYK